MVMSRMTSKLDFFSLLGNKAEKMKAILDDNGFMIDDTNENLCQKILYRHRLYKEMF